MKIPVGETVGASAMRALDMVVVVAFLVAATNGVMAYAGIQSLGFAVTDATPVKGYNLILLSEQIKLSGFAVLVFALHVGLSLAYALVRRLSAGIWGQVAALYLASAVASYYVPLALANHWMGVEAVDWPSISWGLMQSSVFSAMVDRKAPDVDPGYAVFGIGIVVSFAACALSLLMSHFRAPKQVKFVRTV